jgi:hypothetical protein
VGAATPSAFARKAELLLTPIKPGERAVAPLAEAQDSFLALAGAEKVLFGRKRASGLGSVGSLLAGSAAPLHVVPVPFTARFSVSLSEHDSTLRFHDHHAA